MAGLGGEGEGGGGGGTGGERDVRKLVMWGEEERRNGGAGLEKEGTGEVGENGGTWRLWEKAQGIRPAITGTDVPIDRSHRTGSPGSEAEANFRLPRPSSDSSQPRRSWG